MTRKSPTTAESWVSVTVVLEPALVLMPPPFCTTYVSLTVPLLAMPPKNVPVAGWILTFCAEVPCTSSVPLTVRLLDPPNASVAPGDTVMVTPDSMVAGPLKVTVPDQVALCVMLPEMPPESLEPEPEPEPEPDPDPDPSPESATSTTQAARGRLTTRSSKFFITRR